MMGKQSEEVTDRTMNKKATRVLVVGLIFVFTFCVVVFVLQRIQLNRKGTQTIGDLGAFYMSGMSEQASEHFGRTIEMLFSQLGDMLEANSEPDELLPISDNGEAVMEPVRASLRYYAKARGFQYLALCDKQGELDILFGDPLDIQEEDSFMTALTGGEEKMAVGTGQDGKDILLAGSPASYEMKNGEESVALIAGLPMSYLSESLSLDIEKSPIYYFVIRQDGTFVLRDEDVTDATYFDRVRNRYKSVEEKNGEQYIKELQAAMEKGESYTSGFNIFDEERILYGTSLPYSDWYLLMFLPNGELNSTIDSLSRSWTYTTRISLLLILLALTVVVCWYSYLMRQQMKELAEAHAEAEASSRAKSEFLSNMSHDIRTPMNGIVGMTAIASSNMDDPKQVRECLEKISRSGKHLLGLINDILDMSKIERGKLTIHMEAISLQETVQGVSDIVLSQFNTRQQEFHVQTTYVVGGEYVYCDSIRLNQILLNLLGNASKFTQEGGEIQLTLFEEESPKGDQYVRVNLQVRDNGIGMSKEIQEKIFDAFVREDNARVQKTEGSGLGLTITKYIVDALGGSIQVKSEEKKGSEFHVILDLEKAPAMEKTIQQKEESAQQKKAIQQKEEAAQQKKTIQKKEEPTWQEEETIQQKEEPTRQKEKMIRQKEEMTSQEETEEPSGKKGEDGLKLAGKQILLAEDNELNWEIAEALLSSLGLKLEWAEDGKICVEKFQQSEPGYYDAVITDLRMPNMTGYEAAKAIRSLDREDARSVPIIAMSADAFADDVQKCLDCGMNAHVAKPIDMKEVTQLLEQYILHVEKE